MTRKRLVRVFLTLTVTGGCLAYILWQLNVRRTAHILVHSNLGWFAGAVLDWERQLGFSLGVTQQLLPFGDQISGLEPVADLWYVVVPAGALIVGLLAAMVGGLAGGLWAALVNRGFTSIEVTVAPEEAPAHRAISSSGARRSAR